MKFLKIIFALFVVSTLLNACRKEYSIEGAGGKLAVGNWEFMANTHYMGNMDSAYIISTGASNELHLEGTSNDGSQKFNMVLYSDSFNVGSYKASLFQSSFDYTTTAKTIYEASQTVGEFVVNITSVSNGLIVGTFLGKAMDSTNKILDITQGKFKATLGSTGTTTVSSGVLGDSSGTCKPAVLNGIYAQGIATDSNTVQLQVTVAVPGSYMIFTNSVNGVSFLASGTFTNTGVQSVTLKASGTPTGSGNQTFTVKYGNSQCAFSIVFSSLAAGTLGGGGGNCTPFVFSGTYQQGTLLNASNTVQIQVNVTTLGGYNITSNTVNGVSFSSSGIFTSIGLQNVTLKGTGTPLNAGVQNFAITFGPGTCNFSLTFSAGVTPSNDYFPLSLNSNWTYLYNSTDSILQKVISYAPTLGGKNYQTIAQYNLLNPAQAVDSFYYRKPGGDYYQYINYSTYFGFDQPTLGEFIFLKDNVAAGTTWQSPTVSGTLSGIPISVYAKMTLLEKAVPLTLGGFDFPDVIKVKYDFFIVGAPLSVYSMERWFAKNSGEIYNSTSTGGVYQISKFQIL
jgi:hypothetical protein